MKKILVIIAAALLGGLFAEEADACTGISLAAADGSHVVARTVEWAATPMQCGFVVAPRGHAHQSYTPRRLLPQPGLRPSGPLRGQPPSPAAPKGSPLLFLLCPRSPTPTGCPHSGPQLPPPGGLAALGGTLLPRAEAAGPPGRQPASCGPFPPSPGSPLQR